MESGLKGSFPGFERHVPGYPRYRYAGDPSKGEHHLVIKGVTLQDDGEYQCQVGPTADTRPIWASANVTVMVAPERVALLGREDGSVVEVMTGSGVALECQVGKARPPPAVAWYRDGLLLHQGLHEDQVQTAPQSRLWSVRSRLALTATKEDDRIPFSCRAVHPALPEDTAKPLEVSVTLSVLHPPNAPIISGYKNSDVLLSGDRRTLTCRVVGGNPRPRVSWYWYGRPSNTTEAGEEGDAGGEEEADEGEPLAAGEGVELGGTPQYKKTKNIVGISVSRQVIATRQEDGAVYQCRVNSELLHQALTVNITITVHYAPDDVALTGPTVVTAGEQYTLSCVTTAANPPATLFWRINGERVETSPALERRDGQGGWITSSQLARRAEQSLGLTEARVECVARHPALKADVTKTRLINVIRSPGQPVLEAESRGKLVTGSILELTCVTHGGFPPPEIQLFKGGAPLEVSVKQRGNATSARAALKVAPADNGAEVRCQVSNAATPVPLADTATINLLFPPWEATAWAQPAQVEAGATTSLACETSSSLPPAVLAWRSGGEELRGADTQRSPGRYGGTVTRSELKVKASPEDNGRRYTCEADNGLGVVVAANVTLSVLHGPRWVSAPAGRLDVKEGEDLSVSAQAAANPGPIRYSWWVHGKRLAEGEGDEGGRLLLPSVTRLQAGEYSVTAEGPGASITASFTVNVLFGPEDALATKRVVVERGGSATLLCSAHGNPTPTITWTRDVAGDGSSGERVSTGAGEARVQLERASQADTGSYLCTASSAVGVAPPLAALVIVKQAPWSGGLISSNGSWAAVGDNGRLECRVRAFPKPSFTWKDRNNTTLSSSDKYDIRETQREDGEVKWSSALVVRGVARGDYGNYSCVATNALGSFDASLALFPPPTPNAPTNLTVMSLTSDAVTLSWSASSEGGPPAGFTVKYWPAGTRMFEMEDVSGGSTNFTSITGLSAGLEYFFSIQAYNEQGRSPHSAPPLPVTLLGVVESASSPSTGEGGGPRVIRVPRLLLLIMTLAGTALLALNMAIIACFVRRRAAHTNRGVSASSSKNTTLEAFSAATSPASPHRDGLPLTTTSASEDSQKIDLKGECQTDVDNCDQTKLLTTQPSGPMAPRVVGPLLGDASRLERPAKTSSQTFPANGSIYSCSPITQSDLVLPERSTALGSTNHPDVCPTSTAMTAHYTQQHNNHLQQHQCIQQQQLHQHRCHQQQPQPQMQPNLIQNHKQQQLQYQIFAQHPNHKYQLNHQMQPSSQHHPLAEPAVCTVGSSQPQLEARSPAPAITTYATLDPRDLARSVGEHLAASGSVRSYATVAPRRQRPPTSRSSTLQRNATICTSEMDPGAVVGVGVTEGNAAGNNWPSTGSQKEQQAPASGERASAAPPASRGLVRRASLFADFSWQSPLQTHCPLNPGSSKENPDGKADTSNS
ncbi:nephrin-like [Penaeus japonicus]|uniref:nephrin-like n=1 Tax=Penaeus japonicus TaxID=27405 RepID=UPI001C7156B2|nr:nephrin-like [Penaeus japonicus]